MYNVTNGFRVKTETRMEFHFVVLLATLRRVMESVLPTDAPLGLYESLQVANSEDEVCYDSLHGIVGENVKSRSTEIDVEDVGTDHVIHCGLLTAVAALMMTMMTGTLGRVHHRGAVEMQQRGTPERATTTWFLLLLISIMGRGLYCSGCGARNLFMQSQGCGAGNIKIQSKGIGTCSTATLNYSRSIHIRKYLQMGIS